MVRVPDLESGNILTKPLSHLADADSAGLLPGARVPISLGRRDWARAQAPMRFARSLRTLAEVALA